RQAGRTIAQIPGIISRINCLIRGNCPTPQPTTTARRRHAPDNASQMSANVIQDIFATQELVFQSEILFLLGVLIRLPQTPNHRCTTAYLPTLL
ncbi:hypothetical protein GCK32_007383, partial [Trichostrongylus colubriformis]